jgi:hypothetical protein
MCPALASQTSKNRFEALEVQELEQSTEVIRTADGRVAEQVDDLTWIVQASDTRLELVELVSRETPIGEVVFNDPARPIRDIPFLTVAEGTLRWNRQHGRRMWHLWSNRRSDMFAVVASIDDAKVNLRAEIEW